MNFAVIGLGSFGSKRAQAIKKSKVAKLKAIFDVNNQNLEKAKKILNVETFSLDKILDSRDIEVICICTPLLGSER